MTAHVYLLTEGVHDVYFLGRILKESLGFKKLDKYSAFKAECEEWDILIPKNFPYEDSLRPSIPAPTFYRKTNASGKTSASVAIVSAEGETNLQKKLNAHLPRLKDKGVALDAIGIALDADFKKANQQPPSQRFETLASALDALGVPRPAAMDKVTSGPPRTGIFVLPGGGALGTLEDVLLECAGVAYPALQRQAIGFIDSIDCSESSYTRNELKEFNAPAGKNKAILAAMTAFLKPGKAIHTSIEDHRWVDNETLALPRVAAIERFLLDLVGELPAASK